MIFLKEHLAEKYLWHPDKEKSSFTGESTRRLFDRYNGDQVLFMINLFISLNNSLTIEDGLKIENQIRNHLPPEKQSEISVLDCLIKLNQSPKNKQEDQYIHLSNAEKVNSHLNGSEKN